MANFVGKLKQRGTVFYISSPGLWYEHRRDAHNVYRQPNGNVWAPFYEMPWARSGKGVAWDGLSLYDVSRYNPWYFDRHREFIKLAGQQGLIVYVNLYNDHDVLEIGPHWIDYAWRPANNINDTGLPEPPPLKPNNRNDVGNEFFGTEYPPLRKLHHDYIFHTLDELGDLPNAIFTAAYQFAGPLSFEQFLQDTIAEWEKLHGKHIPHRAGDRQEHHGCDPCRSGAVKAGLRDRYALLGVPAGRDAVGSACRYQRCIPRADREAVQRATPIRRPATTPEMVYKEVREYRDRFPNIALLPMEDGAGPLPVLMGGAVFAVVVAGRHGAAACCGYRMHRVFRALPARARGAAPPAGAGRPRGPSPDAIIDKFVADYLAKDLMKMGPAGRDRR